MTVWRRAGLCGTAIAILLSAVVIAVNDARSSNTSAASSCSQLPPASPFALRNYANAVISHTEVEGRAGVKVGNANAGQYTAWMPGTDVSWAAVTAGETYTFEAVIEAESASYYQAIRGQIEWRQSSGELISYSQGELYVVGGSQGLQDVLVSGTAPAGAARAVPKIAITSNSPAGSAVYVAAALFASGVAGSPDVAVCQTGGPRLVLKEARGLPKRARQKKHNPFGPWLGQGATKHEPCPIPHTEKQCPLYDKNGIPVVHYDGQFGITGTQYNPLTIAQNGLDFYSSYLYTHNKRQRQQVMRDARWLVRNQTRDGRFLYHFRLPAYETSSHWASAMAQGGAAALLVRVWHLTGDGRYLRAATRALRPFSQPVRAGGVLDFYLGRYPFYEEAASIKMPTFILNGYLYTLVGLYEVARAVPSSAAGKLYMIGFRSLVTMLPLYDNGPGMSLYDLEHLTTGRGAKATADEHYNSVHVQLLRVIDSFTPNRVLRYYRKRWS